MPQQQRSRLAEAALLLEEEEDEAAGPPARPDQGSGIGASPAGRSRVTEALALLEEEPDPVEASTPSPRAALSPMRPVASHGRPTLEDTFGLRPMASHATGPSFNDLNNKSDRAAAMTAGRPALPAAPEPLSAQPQAVTPFATSVAEDRPSVDLASLSAPMSPARSHRPLDPMARRHGQIAPLSPIASHGRTATIPASVLTRQGTDSSRFGGFMAKGPEVRNRTESGRLLASERLLADLLFDRADSSAVIVDIGSGLGHPDPNVAGATVRDLIANPVISKKAHVVATDIASEMPRTLPAGLDAAAIPDNFRIPVRDLADRQGRKDTVILRAANSIDLLMDPSQAQQHFTDVAEQLLDRDVFYLFNRHVLRKPKGETAFNEVGSLSDVGFEHNGRPWQGDSPSEASYTLDPSVREMRPMASHDQATAAPLTADPTTPAPTFGDRATDVGISALKSAISIPEAALGLGDIVTGGRAGKAAADMGLDPGLAKQILSRFYSPAQQAAYRSVDEADGVLDTIAAALANPSVIGHSVIESAASMLGGAGIARGLAGRVAPIVAGAVGEGAVSAGLAAEQTRQASETGLLTPGQAALAATSGAATGGLGVLGGKLAQRLGIADIDTLLAGATRSVEAQRGLARQVLYGAIQEGLFEELPQSVQEQVLQNAAQGKPLHEGVSQSAVLGALAGAVMGGGAQAFTALAGPGGGPAPMRPVPSHESTKPQPPVDPKPIIPTAEPFLDQTPTPADLAVEELAAVRGTPADIPDNPVAQQLEAARTAPPVADETAETGRLAGATALLEMEPEGSDARTGTQSDRATPSRSRATSPPAFGDSPTSPTPGEFYTMRPDEIAVDPSRFQFKAGGNTAGVTAAAKIDGPWNEARAGVLMVWKDPADGQTYVVNGHHRLEAAKRLGAERVAVRYVEAPDATTARVEGALTNISEDKGTPLDAAKLIRDAGFEQSDLVEAGLSPKSALLRDGLGLAALSDPLFARVVAGEIDEKTGGAIGSAGLSPEGQAAVATLVERQQAKGRTLTPAQVRVLAQDVASTPEVKADDGGQASIFDLMGEERTQNVAVEKAVLRDWARQQLAQDKRLFGFVAKDGRADALARGGNRIDVNQSKAIADEAGQVAAVFDRLAGSAGPVSRALNAAAVRMAEGTPSHEVRTGLLADLRSAVAAELGRPAPQADRDGKGPGRRVGQEAHRERRAADPQPDVDESATVGQRPDSRADNTRGRSNVVDQSVRSGRLDREVLDPIIGAIPVDVVDMLGGQKGAAEMLLHDPAMFARRLTSKGRVDVTSNIAALLPVVAASRTKLGGLGSGRGRAEHLSALDTFDRHLREALARLRSPEATSAVAPGNVLPVATPGAEAPVASGDLARDGRERPTTKLAGPVDRHFGSVAKAGSAAPAVPYSRDALQAAFNLTDEQAVATDALVEAMGLDTSRIRIAKGGVPGANALEQDDLLDTGERQPRLPEAGDVRDKEVATPLLAEPEFRLTSEVAKPKKVDQPTLFQAPETPFYSRLIRAVEDSKQTKASGAQWKATVRNAKTGINQDEFALVGVQDLQDATTYTREEVLEYLRLNQVVVQAVVLGDNHALRDRWTAANTAVVSQARREEFTERGAQEYARDAARGDLSEAQERMMSVAMRPLVANLRAADEAAADHNETGRWPARETHFDTYQLGGANDGSYREVLLTAPRPSGFDASKVQIKRALQSTTQGSAEIWYDGKKVGSFADHPTLSAGGGYTRATTESWMATAEAIYEKGLKFAGIQPLSSHWRDGHEQYKDIVNPVVRLRFNVRETAGDTPRTVLFLEEVQAPSKANFAKMPALFQKHWRDLAFKWAVRHAVENGYDGVAWTTGAQQAERYSLEAHVEEIRWGAIDTETPIGKAGASKYVQIMPKDSGTIRLALASDGVVVKVQVGDHSLTGKHVADIIGKEVGGQIVEAATGELSGEGLKIGGHGLRKLYDVDFKNVVQGLPAVKKHGGRVATVPIQRREPGLPLYEGPDATLEQAQEVNELSRQRGNVWVSPITGERQSAVISRVDVNHPMAKIVTAMESGVSFRDAMNAEGNGAIAAIFGGTFEAKPVVTTPTVPALMLTPAIRAAVLGGQPLFQGAKGSAEFTRDGKAIIRGLAAADVSTGIHEIAHVARRQLLNREVPADERRGISDDDITTAEQWAGAVDGVWSVEAEEKLARGFERYLMAGAAPDGRLRRIFAQFQSWLTEVYQTITGSGVDIDVSPAMRSVFDRLTTRALPVSDKKPSRPTGKSDLPVTPKRPRADQVSALPVGPRRSSESPEQMSARLVKAVDADTAGYVRRYRAQFGRIVNGDNASELFPEYVADRSAHERTVRPAAAKIVNAVFAELLAEPVPADRKAIAVFTSGGNGSGKSTATSGEVAGHVTFDSTLSQFDASVAKIDQALAAGLEVRIRHTARHPVEAWTNGVLSRAMAPNHPQAGRTVSLNGHAVTHGRARETLVQLADHYADNPRVQFVVRENRPDGTMTTRSVDWLREQRYPVGDDLRAHLRTALEDARASGRISQAVYDGAAGHASRPRPDRPADGRSVQEEPRPRPQPPVTPKVTAAKPAPPVDSKPDARKPAVEDVLTSKTRPGPAAILRGLSTALATKPTSPAGLRRVFLDEGHDFDTAILNLPRTDERWSAELVSLGRAVSSSPVKAWQARREGVAEFFRLFVTDKAAAQVAAPAYFEAVTARLAEHPRWQALLGGQRGGRPTGSTQGMPLRPADPLRDEVQGAPAMPFGMADELAAPAKPSGKLVSLPQVIHSLGDVTAAAGKQIALRVGRVRGQHHGQWNTRTHVARTRAANDVPTATHEVAHALQTLLWTDRSGRSPWVAPLASNEMQRELAALGKALYGDRVPVGGYKSEGWAEFIRVWVTGSDLQGQPADLSKLAPRTLAWFTQTFAVDHPKVFKALEATRDLTTRWRSQGAVARAQASLVDRGTLRTRTTAVVRAVRGFFTLPKLVEMAQPLHELAREAERVMGRVLEPSEDPFLTTSALRSTHSARTKYMVDTAMIDLAGNRVGPALAEIRSLVEGHRRDFAIYLWARRSLALHDDPLGPRNPGLSRADAVQIIRELQTPAFELAAAKVYAWNNGVLDYAGQASPTFAQVVAKVRQRDPGDYVPLQRVFEEMDDLWARSAGSSRGGATSRSPVKRLTGSGRQVKDIFPVMIGQAENTIRQAHQRMVLDQILKLASLEGMGHLIEEVAPDQAPATSRTVADLLRQINREAQRQNPGATPIDLEAIEADVMETAITFFAPVTRPKGQDPIVPIYDQGKVRWFQVDGPLFDTLSSLDVYRLPDVAGVPVAEWLLGKPATLFRAGTTGLRASFSLIWNPLRDVQTFSVNTRSTRSSAVNFAKFMRAMVGMGLSRTTGHTSDWVDAWIRLGGEMAQPLGEDVPHTRRAARQLFEGRVVRTLDPRNWFDFYRDLIQFPEGAGRVAELETVAEQVGWQPGQPMTLDQSLQMLLASKQVTTDFTAAGSVARVVNRMVPFHNAAIQGPRASLRAMRRHPALFAWRGLQITAVTLLLWWENKDEEWYANMPYRDRFLHWWFPTTIDGREELARIPRAFDIGMIFAALPEMLMDAWYREEPEQVTEWFGTLMDTMSPPALPVVPRVAKEQWKNRQWPDRPIVPLSLSRKPAAEQFTEYTSRAAILIGDLFEVSPLRVEHAIRGTLGPVSMDVVSMLGLGPTGTPGIDEPADWPVVGRLFQRGGTLGTQPKPIADLYELAEQAQLRQHSDRDPEDARARQQRLQLGDATTAISALMSVRRYRADVGQQRQLTAAAVKIANEAMAAHRSGTVAREHFAAYRQGAEELKKAAKPAPPVTPRR